MGKKIKITISDRAAGIIDNCPVEDMAQVNAGWVANKLKLHPSYLSRVFKEESGFPLKDYIEQVKMDRAQELLEATNLPVKEIAALLDYANPGYFSRKFREHKGMSPRRRRRIHRLLPREIEPPAGLAVAVTPAPADPVPRETETGREEPLWKIVKKRFNKYFRKKF